MSVYPNQVDLHRFALLPAEISSLVWQFFAIPGPFLDDRTRPATTALTVCKDNRFLVLRSLPDTLAVKRGRRRGVVRFNKDRDIVAISTFGVLDLVNNFQFDGLGVPLHDAYKHCIIPGLSDNICNLAFKGMVTDDYLGIITQVERYPFMISLWHLLAMFRDA
ncbi:hypothetical protein MCOR25_009490 [Pyricularia grisea]|nr:hypothetical protein MCOR25_009490 [Pyricularia grisea]